MNDLLKEKLRNLPDKPGCYIYRDRKGTIIYVGKAVSLRRRVQSYFRASTLRSAPPRLRSLVNHVEDLEIRVVRNEAEALLTESHLIKQYRPRFNILMRDDKRYPALRADPDVPYPRITACRIIRDDGARYFGPFPYGSVSTAIDFIEKRFGLRKCTAIIPDTDTHTHCMADIIRFCSAPCLGRVSQEEYRARFEEACAFLRGDRPAVIEELKAQMLAASEKHDYEKAARLRDTWLALRDILSQKARVVQTQAAKDRIAGEGLEELQQRLALPTLPRIIECFDISHLFGANTVASMVAAVDAVPDRRRYRRFHIKSVDGIDDPRSIAEAVRRRYTRLQAEEKPLPDLILIDGGITQLRAARAALAELGLATLPTAGLAERLEEIVLDNGHPNLLLPRDDKGLRILIRLRDEAHRFAITFNRRLRQRAIRESVLDDIPGIGPARKQQLLTAFGSVYRLAAATEAEIAAQPGMTPLLASTVKHALQMGWKEID